MVKRKRTVSKRDILSAMGKCIRAAGYNAIARQVREGKRVRANVFYFLKLYKKTAYGKFHSIKKGKVDRIGKINPEYRKLYDKTERLLLNGIAAYESKKSGHAKRAK